MSPRQPHREAGPMAPGMRMDLIEVTPEEGEKK
jgi:hypothetical protein